MKTVVLRYLERQEALDVIEEHLVSFLQERENIAPLIRKHGFTSIVKKPLEQWTDREITSYFRENSLFNFLFEEDTPECAGINFANANELPMVQISYTQKEWEDDEKHNSLHP